jgi:hypothetical protein
MRSARFTGCGGNISFSRTSNDISFKWLDVSQYRTDLSDNLKLHLTHIGTVKSLSSHPYSLGPFIWPNGATKTPEDTRHVEKDCPFPDDEITTSELGQAISFSVASVVLVYSTIVLFFLWKKFW